jgi:AraC family transcriptional regulator
MSEIFRDGHFAGTVLAARRVGSLSLAETRYAPGARVAAHAHDHAMCCLVLEGGFTEHAGRKPRVLDAGALLFHPADEAHAHDFHRSGGHCFNIQFGAEWARRMREFGVHWPATPVDLRESRGRWIAEHLRAEIRGSDAASALIIDGFALALLGEASRQAIPRERTRARPAWLDRTVDLLDARFDEPIGLAEVAAAVEVHPAHLARTFREHYGCTMGEYVRTRRIEAARHRLAHTHDPLAEIALDAGYADQAHFSRHFKRVTGLTPGAYRRISIGR